MKTAKVLSNIILYIILIIITIMTLFPFLWGLASSFRTTDELFKYAIPFSSKTLIPQEPTFDAYYRLFTYYKFLRPILNTLIITAVQILLISLVNSAAAFGFAFFNFKFKGLIFAVVLISFMVPGDALILPLYILVQNLGWVDTYFAVIVPGVADGFVLFLFTQFFRDIPISLIEAARVDGAGWVTIFLKIVIPSSIVVFITAGLMTFMNVWNSYFWPLLVARSRNIQLIQTALATTRTEHSTDWAVLYAGSIIAALVPLFLFLPLQKYFVQGYVSTGIKG
jgi:ABC-type glycerol-3-phosphate transport system permease component